MTQDELKAALLLIGFIDRGVHAYSHAYSLPDKSLWVMFNSYDITIQRRGLFPYYRWSTFLTSPQAAFDFIREQLI